MEAIKMTLSEKIEQELERDLQKAMEDKDFNLLVKRLKISKDLAKKPQTILTAKTATQKAKTKVYEA